MTPRLGLKAKMYFLSTGSRATWGAADANGLHAGPAPTNLTEITSVGDLNYKHEDGKAEVPTRGNNGYMAKLPTLSDVGLSFDIVYDPADVAVLALLKAKIAKSTIACAVLDGDKAVVGNIGFWADFHVFTTEKVENLQEGQKFNLTLEPGLTSVPPEWVIITA